MNNFGFIGRFTVKEGKREHLVGLLIKASKVVR